MKIIFAGTPVFAEKALHAMLEQKLDVVAVLTQPDKPAGRGMQLKPSPVKEIAMQHGLTILQPSNLKGTEIQEQLLKYSADLMVVAAYGLILPSNILKIPHYGCLNIHASLLPRWRGAAPIQRAIQAGDTNTGITIMQMDEGLDTGDILLLRPCEINKTDTAGSLHDKLAQLGAGAIVETLDLLAKNQLTVTPQDNLNATYAAKLTKEEATINWSLTSFELNRRVRSYNPFPGANSRIKNTQVKIWQASVRQDMSGIPGMVLAVEKNALVVACGDGALNIEVIQKPNSKALPVGLFLQGFPINEGDSFVLH